MDRPLFFIHIPKTAGTSLWHSLVKGYKQKEIFPSKREIKANNGDYPSFDQIVNSYSIESLKDRKFYYGHYPYRFINNMVSVKEVDIITFLRNPIERTISHLRHVKLNDNRYRNSDLISILKDKGLHFGTFNNVQTRFLTSGAPAEELSYRSLLLAKRNIKDFFFVGITEEYEKSLVKLESKLGRSLDSSKANVFKEKISKEKDELKDYGVTDELLVNIYKNNIYDIELYNWATHRFNNSKS